MALMNIRGITVAFSGNPVLDNVDLVVEPGERVCLVGRNGEGKSTLMRVMARDMEPDAGTVAWSSGLKVARLSQKVDFQITGTVHEVAASGLGELAGLDPEAHRRVDTAISKLKLDAEADFNALSGGLKRRTLLARCLAMEPDILLLDEPTNHLDVESIEWLETFLPRNAPTIVFITHDRAFLRALATRIIELDRGNLTSWACGYDEYLKRKQDLLEAEAKQNANFDKKLAEEEVWIRQGIKARRTRNMGRVRKLREMRKERRARREQQGNARMQVQVAQKSGKLVADLDSVSFSYGEEKVIDSFTAIVQRGDKIGIVGPNGAGKTTLLRLLLGELEPQEGLVKLGTKLEPSYFDQMRSTLKENLTADKNVADGDDQVIIDGQPRHVMGYLRDFLFTPDRARTIVSVLSGGERNRLLLAKLFSRPSNLLVLDEPTNDLDVETLELLEELVSDYPGTVLMVSHDREFLNNTATSIFALEGQGRVVEYVGGYDDWVALREPVCIEKPATEKTKKQKNCQPDTAKPAKLSFKEKRAIELGRVEIEELPLKIEELDSTLAELQEALCDPDLYRKDPKDVQALNDKVAATEAELEKAYARWEELEELLANAPDDI